jgi:hypothetical protein
MTKTLIYKSFIRPKLEYVSVIYDGCSKLLADHLESVQRQAAMACSGAYKRTRHTSLLDELGWETLAIRRKVHKLLLFFKIHQGLTPFYLNTYYHTEYLQSLIMNYVTRMIIEMYLPEQ